MKAPIVLALLGATTLARADAPKCSFTQTGDLDLVSGAATSTVQIRSTIACIKGLETQLVMSSTSGSMLADLKKDKDTASLTLHDVPTLTPGALDWKLGSNYTVTLKSSALTLQQLIVTYGERSIDGRQVGIATKTDRGWIAVAQRRKPHEDADWDDIVNTAQFDAAPRLLHPSKGYWVLDNSTWGSSAPFQYQGCDEVNLSRIRFAVVRRLKSPLRVSAKLVEGRDVLVNIDLTLASESRKESIPLSLTSALKVRCDDSRWFGDRWSLAHDGGSIAIDYDAFAEKKCRLEVDYSQADGVLGTGLSTTSDSTRAYLSDTLHDAQARQGEAERHAKDTQELAKSAAELAKSAKQVADTNGATTSQKDSAREAELTRAAADSEAHAAQVAADRAAACVRSKAERLRDNEMLGFTDAQRAKNMYGEQALEITLKRGSKQGVTVAVVSPTAPLVSIPLVEPPGMSDEAGPYHVSIKPVSQQDVVYREGSLPSGDGGDSRLLFDATLRPRGSVGLTHYARFYATFPVIPFSLRFPARTSDIQSTAHDTHIVQLDSRAGAMLALEPWDFDHDKNSWLIPISFQAGLSATSAELSRTSVMVGVSLDFPIIPKTATETSIAIGAFYEVGLENGWSHTHRGFVLTFGLDIFRALKSNADSEKKQ